jgi:hypothetical protein
VNFSLNEVIFLRHVILGEDIFMDLKKVEVVFKCKSLMSVVVTHFQGSPFKKEKIQTNQKHCQKKTKKKISEKRTPGYPENDQTLVEEVKKIKRLKFDSIFSTDASPVGKENSI